MKVAPVVLMAVVLLGPRPLAAQAPGTPMVDAYAAACATLGAAPIARAAATLGFAAADQATRERIGALNATTVWVRGDPARPEILRWREPETICELGGLVTDPEPIYAAFLRYVAPQQVVAHNFDQRDRARFARVRLTDGQVQALGFGVYPMQGQPFVLMSRRPSLEPPAR